MNACAAFERWQPGIDSLVGVSQYAVAPGASTRQDSLFVLPAQRPASPEIAESPSVTTAGAPTPGPSAATGAARASVAMVRMRQTRPIARIEHPPSWARHPGHERDSCQERARPRPI